MADNYSKFHEIWGTCVESPGYNKRHWKFLSEIMDEADKNNNVDKQENVLFMANLLAASQKYI